MDDGSLINLILSIINIVSNLILHYKLKQCNVFCMKSECVNSPNNSQINTPNEIINMNIHNNENIKNSTI